ncbi:hypothetical protein Taro_038200 [Colocasia esculenta]|uniref:Uncharacterized protein n=1 Tax=Colocasia esculenta TaxID=4460 RepID=A0A843WIH3_COLES|nr:hypothetical protein [Colocasia esculenta]
MSSEQMASGSGLRPWRHRITLQQNVSTLSDPLSFAAASTNQFLRKLGVGDMDVRASSENIADRSKAN